MDHINNPPPKTPPAEDQKAAEAHIGQGETLEGGRQIQPDKDPAGDQGGALEGAQGGQVQPAACAAGVTFVPGADQVQPAAEQTGDQAAANLSILDRLSKIDSCVACVQISLIDLRDEIKNDIEAIRQQYASES